MREKRGGEEEKREKRREEAKGELDSRSQRKKNKVESKKIRSRGWVKVVCERVYSY